MFYCGKDFSLSLLFSHSCLYLILLLILSHVLEKYIEIKILQCFVFFSSVLLIRILHVCKRVIGIVSTLDTRSSFVSPFIVLYHIVCFYCYSLFFRFFTGLICISFNNNHSNSYVRSSIQLQASYAERVCVYVLHINAPPPQLSRNNRQFAVL